MPIVSVRNVERWFGDGDARVAVLRTVSFDIARNDFVAITGPSGSGKSTLMNIIGLLDRATSGSVALAGRDVGRQSDDDMARLRGEAIGFVFQSYNLLARSTALENVELPLLYARGRTKDRRDRALRMLSAVGLAAKANHLPSQLSGGEQQRVAIARALVRRPPLLLADEPTGALDSATGAEILALFRALHRSGQTVVMITHDPQVAARCDRIIRMRDGRVVPAPPSDAVGTDAARPPPPARRAGGGGPVGSRPGG